MHFFGAITNFNSQAQGHIHAPESHDHAVGFKLQAFDENGHSVALGLGRVDKTFQVVPVHLVGNSTADDSYCLVHLRTSTTISALAMLQMPTLISVMN